jgi:hypothetical protein
VAVSVAESDAAYNGLKPREHTNVGMALGPYFSFGFFIPIRLREKTREVIE